MKFLVDADLPRSTAQTLSAAGHDAQHVSDAGLGGASDREIFDHAQSLGAVLVTRDLDFTHPMNFPETSHHGVMIVRIRESLPPDFVNHAIASTVGLLQAADFENAIVIVEENRFRRRVLQQP